MRITSEGGTAPLGLIFGQQILSIWSDMFQGTPNSQFYFSKYNYCDVTVKKCAKVNIFNVLSHKSITTFSEIPV